jgi:hypothetical protein
LDFLRSAEKIALRRPPGVRKQGEEKDGVSHSGQFDADAAAGLSQIVSCQRAPGNDQQGKAVTTLTINNLTTDVTPEVFMEHLDEIGLGGTYDYLYMPQVQQSIELSSSVKRIECSNKSYAFVNFTEKMEPSALQSALLRSNFPNKDQLVVAPAKQQGVFKNLEEIHNSGIENCSSSLFDKVWVQFNKVLKRMDAPTAYLIYRINEKA